MKLYLQLIFIEESDIKWRRGCIWKCDRRGML